MTPSPATGHTILDWLTTAAVLTFLAALLGYAAVCALWPYGVCRRCHGASRLVTRRGRLARRCRRCRGHGLRLRVGRRAWNRWSRFRHARRADHLRGQLNAPPWRNR